MIEEEQQSPQELARFSSSNPEATIVEAEKAFVVREPWGDDTLAIIVPKSEKGLIKALNGVRLPPKFTAIFHESGSDVEFIYGPLAEDSPLRSRAFDFHFLGDTYSCEYADASETLYAIAEASRPTKPPSETDHRNLTGIRDILRYQSEESELEQDYVLTSFWIRGVDMEEDEMAEFARHLNFYMSYFDKKSPQVLIHEEASESRLAEPESSLPISFPEEITGRQLDSYLLVLQESAKTAGGPFRRFLYNYQILEYAAFYYLKDAISRSVKQVLRSPDLTSDTSKASQRILDIVTEDRMDDVSKLNAVVKQYVNPKSLWPEIDRRADFFTTSTEFDGGYVIPSLYKQGGDFEDFESAWMPKLPHTLRKLRNSLVHARELQQSGTITPTSRNQQLLRPWADLMEAIAKQTMVYGQL